MAYLVKHYIRICKANSMSWGLPDDETYNSVNNHFLVSSVRPGLGWALGLELAVLKLGIHELINDVMSVASFNHGSIKRRNLHSPSTLRTTSIKAWLLLPIPGTAVEMSKKAPLFTWSLFQGNSKLILIRLNLVLWLHMVPLSWHFSFPELTYETNRKHHGCIATIHSTKHTLTETPAGTLLYCRGSLPRRWTWNGWIHERNSWRRPSRPKRSVIDFLCHVNCSRIHPFQLHLYVQTVSVLARILK